MISTLLMNKQKVIFSLNSRQVLAMFVFAYFRSCPALELILPLQGGSSSDAKYYAGLLDGLACSHPSQ